MSKAMKGVKFRAGVTAVYVPRSRGHPPIDARSQKKEMALDGRPSTKRSSSRCGIGCARQNGGRSAKLQFFSQLVKTSGVR